MLTTKKKKTQKFGGHSQAQVLDAIKNCHGFVSQIADTLGASISAVSNWKKRYVWVTEAFENAEMEMGDYAESQLFELLKKENPAAVFFYLKTRYGSHARLFTVELTHVLNFLIKRRLPHT